VRTFAVFVDLPVHVELALPFMPVLRVGDVVHFEEIRIPRPDGEERPWAVQGPHQISRRKLTYGSRRGLSQYLEFSLVGGQAEGSGL
jgi:hypothetical protein